MGRGAVAAPNGADHEGTPAAYLKLMSRAYWPGVEHKGSETMNVFESENYS
jgi:hypothetical protein